MKLSFLYLIKNQMDILFFGLVVIGIGTLIGISMITPKQGQGRLQLSGEEKSNKSFSWGFFIGMLFPIMLFVILWSIGYLACSKSKCSVQSIMPILSALGVLWISLIAIKIITPFFIGKPHTETISTYRNLRDRKAERIKNLTNYIMYAILLSVLFFSLLFLNIEAIAETLKQFCNDFWWKGSFFDKGYFENFITWIFYVVNISAIVGVISTLKMIANENERSNEYFQEQKLREFESRNRNI